jgi:hypothetical protein
MVFKLKKGAFQTWIIALYVKMKSDSMDIVVVRKMTGSVRWQY